MNPIPKISVITVVFNGEKHIRKTIESVLGQTYKALEYIIIDGKSTDGTLGIIKEYKGIHKVVSEPDNGLYDAMNKGLKLVNGDIIGILKAADPKISFLRDFDTEILEIRRQPAALKGLIRQNG